MTKNDAYFETWFEMLQMNLAAKGIDFHNPDVVYQDYEDGRSMFDVLYEIEAEQGIEK